MSREIIDRLRQLQINLCKDHCKFAPTIHEDGCQSLASDIAELESQLSQPAAEAEVIVNMLYRDDGGLQWLACLGMPKIPGLVDGQVIEFRARVVPAPAGKGE